MLKFPWGEPTHFIEKLWKMAIQQEYFDREEFYYYYGLAKEVKQIQLYDTFAPKLHTIQNQSDRFKVGQKVQPYVCTEKPYRSPQFDFMPPLEIVSKQTFDIIHDSFMFQKKAFVFIDGRKLWEDEIESLAINDGFNSIEHFFQYFTKPVENMEIRHFTNLKY